MPFSEGTLFAFCRGNKIFGSLLSRNRTSLTTGDGRFFYFLVLCKNWTNYQTENQKKWGHQDYQSANASMLCSLLNPTWTFTVLSRTAGHHNFRKLFPPPSGNFLPMIERSVSSCNPHSLLSVNADIRLCRQVLVFFSHSKQILCVWSLISASSFRHSSSTLDSVWRSDPCRVAWRNIQYNSVQCNCRDPALLDWYIAVCFCFLLAISTGTRPASLLSLVLKILVIVQNFWSVRCLCGLSKCLDQISSTLVCVIIWNALQLFGHLTSKLPQSDFVPAKMWLMWFHNLSAINSGARNLLLLSLGYRRLSDPEEHYWLFIK